MTILKPLSTHLVVDLYNEMTSSKDEEIIGSGKGVACISDAIRLETTIDTFHEIDPLLENELIESCLVEAACYLIIK